MFFVKGKVSFLMKLFGHSDCAENSGNGGESFFVSNFGEFGIHFFPFMSFAASGFLCRLSTVEPITPAGKDSGNFHFAAFKLV